LPDIVPIMILARLAIDRKWQVKGLGAALLRDALRRTAQAADIASNTGACHARGSFVRLRQTIPFIGDGRDRPALVLACGASYDYRWSYVRSGAMKELQLKDVKATLSAAVDRAVAGEPTVITRHGRKEAVLVSFKEWERVSKAPSFADLLLAFPGEPRDIPNRRH
jgi:prevent-host-death family protein